jgi:hypothetical protein
MEDNSVLKENDNLLSYDDDSKTSDFKTKLIQLDLMIRELESRLLGATIVNTATNGNVTGGKKFAPESEPLLPRDEIQKILSLLQSYANKVQLIGEGDPATFSKMKWRILTEINERLVTNPATPPPTYKTSLLAVMSTMNNIGNVTLSSRKFFETDFREETNKEPNFKY